MRSCAERDLLIPSSFLRVDSIPISKTLADIDSNRIESASLKSQDTIFLIAFEICVFKVIAGACFFDQMAALIPTELLHLSL